MSKLLKRKINVLSDDITPIVSPLEVSPFGIPLPNPLTKNIKNNCSFLKTPSGFIKKQHKELGDAPSSLPVEMIHRLNKSPIEFSPQSPHFRKDALTIIQYWNSSWGLCRHPLPEGPSDIPTKRILRIIKTIGEVLDGKFLQIWPAYSVQDILRAIDGFKLRATNRDYVPVDKIGIKKVNLDTFFWNSYAPSPRQSMFLECLNNEAQLLKNTIPREKEINPQMTKWLQEFYIEKILLGQPKTFNQVEINKFIRGANQLTEVMKLLRQRANLLTGPYEFCEYVIDALIGAFGQAGITPGHVASAWTYRDCLPKYLSQIGRID